MTAKNEKIQFDLRSLREAVQNEYRVVAEEPEKGFHFHVGRTQVEILDYEEELLEGIPEKAIESVAGTGNPFNINRLKAGENVVDIGCGAGIDSLIAARMVAPDGQVIGIDMTPKMLEKANRAKVESGFDNVEFKHGYGEDLPIGDGWADVIISNGVLNLMPDKNGALSEMARVLKPNGRLQIADILVEKEVSESAKNNIELWTG